MGKAEKDNRTGLNDRRGETRPWYVKQRFSLVAFAVALTVVGIGAYVANQVSTNKRVRTNQVNECERVKTVKIATNVIAGIARFTSTASSEASKRLKVKANAEQRKLQTEYARLTLLIPSLPIVDCSDIVAHPGSYTAEGFKKSDRTGISAYKRQLKDAEEFLKSRDLLPHK